MAKIVFEQGGDRLTFASLPTMTDALAYLERMQTIHDSELVGNILYINYRMPWKRFASYTAIGDDDVRDNR